MNHRLETDEEQDAILSLELVTEHLPRVVTNVHHWKWVILALHNSFQGFMVLALQGTNALNVLTDKSARQWMEAYRKGSTQFAEPKLDWFPNLYEKIESNQMIMYSDSHPFQPAGTQEQSVNQLKDLRDIFVHFVTKPLILDVRSWPHIVSDITGIIEFLAFESGNITWHEESAEQRVKTLCLLIRQQAHALNKHYGG